MVWAEFYSHFNLLKWLNLIAFISLYLKVCMEPNRVGHGSGESFFWIIQLCVISARVVEIKQNNKKCSSTWQGIWGTVRQSEFLPNCGCIVRALMSWQGAAWDMESTQGKCHWAPNAGRGFLIPLTPIMGTIPFTVHWRHYFYWPLTSLMRYNPLTDIIEGAPFLSLTSDVGTFIPSTDH